MKKLVLFFAAFAMIAIAASQSWSQRSQISLPIVPSRASIESRPILSKSSNQRLAYDRSHFSQLSPTVALPGDVLPITTTWDQQSNGRALHNIQVDPSNPLNIHAIVTGTESTDFNKDWTTRRCFYTFSSDGGKTWKTPIILQPGGLNLKRQGYADMILMQRNGKYVPVIACHRYNVNVTDLWTAVYVEKGNPGDGDFSQTFANRTSVDEGDFDIAWPSIALSSDGTTVYVIGGISDNNAAHQLQFGSFSFVSEARDSLKFNGWTAKPGDYSGTSDLGDASNGSYLIHVSQSGTIGVAWWCWFRQPQGQTQTWPAYSIYYSESSDKGQTWSADSIRIAGLSELDAQNRQWLPYGDFDFWFDGDNPKFVYTEDLQDLANSQYVPNSARLIYVDLGGQTAAEIAHADTSTVLADGTTPYPGPLPNILLSSTDVNPGSMIQSATVGRTSSGRLAVFFLSYVQDDYALVNDTNWCFGSLYYVESPDGGDTWSDPQLWKQGNGEDLRYPQVSYFNPMTGSTPNYHVLFSADSMPGVSNINYQDDRYAVNYFVHAVATPGAAGVAGRRDGSAGSLALQPNPFTASAIVTVAPQVAGMMRLVVRDALGRDLYHFEPRMVDAGRELSFELNAKDLNLAPGVYFVTALLGNTEVTRQAVFVK